MQKLKNILLIFVLLGLITKPAVWAVENQPTIDEATESSEATPASLLVEEKPAVDLGEETDLTEPEGPAKSKLEKYLEEQELGPLAITNFLQHVIRSAVSKGVPANVLVLLLLFPLVGAVIAAARHLIGLRGYGLFTTAALSIAFLATGFVVGMLLFVLIIVVASASRVMIRRLRLQYLPRISLLLWFVSLGIFGLVAISPYLGMKELVTISIFPILLLVLFAETFISSRIGLGLRRSVELMVETIVLAVICFLVLSLENLQRFAVLNPEITVLSVAVFDVFLGKYVGLRLLEYWRFREIIGK